MQAYLGIHQPENFDVANSARRRLMFDEFFYLQVILISEVTYSHNLYIFLTCLGYIRSGLRLSCCMCVLI